MKSQADGNTYPIAYPPLKVPKEMVAVALWASVSDKVDRELAGGRAKLKPAEWKSGDNLWLMEIIAPSLSANPQEMKKLLEELASSAFSRRTFKAGG